MSKTKKKYLYAIYTVFFATNISLAQCNCENIKREDGNIITQCPAYPVSSDNTTEIGLSVASNGTSNFLGLTIRHKTQAINVKGKMTLRLLDNNMFSLEFVTSSLSYIGNSQVTNAIFNLSKSNSELLKKSNIKTVSFTLEDNLLHTYQVKLNNDIVKKELNCL